MERILIYYCVTIYVLICLTSSMETKPKRVVLKLILVPKPTKDTVGINYDNGDYDLQNPFLPLYALRDIANVMVEFKMGKPPVQQFTLVDTGSDKIWVLCKNYTSTRTRTNLFDPLESDSYVQVGCRDPICPSTHCPTPSDPCFFDKKYGKGKNGKNVVAFGALAMERFYFSTSDNGTVLDQVVFGCVDELSFNPAVITGDPRFNGVLGLSDLTFLANIGGGRPQFSLCLGDLTDPDDFANSHLMMGQDVELIGNSARLRVGQHSHFTVVAESIFLGGENLNFDHTSFVFDSGATLVYFERCDRIKAAIQQLLLSIGFRYNNSTGDGRAIDYKPGDCFSGYVKLIRTFPGLRLRFEDKLGQDFVLGPINLFHRLGTSTYFCFGIKPSNHSTNIIGLQGMQGFNLGFDIAAETLYYLNLNCSGLT